MDGLNDGEARPQGFAARRANHVTRPDAPAIELQTLTDGGQRSADIARGIADFLAASRRSLDIAMYDIRTETEASWLLPSAVSRCG